MERLRQEPLDLPGTRYSQLVLLRQLIHTQNSNDVLQVFVVLQQTPDLSEPAQVSQSAV